MRNRFVTFGAFLLWGATQLGQAQNPITREQMIQNAENWAFAKPDPKYSESNYFASPTDYWSDGKGDNPGPGWREDCSGFVSYVWGFWDSDGGFITTTVLPTSQGGAGYSTELCAQAQDCWGSLLPGDALVYNVGINGPGVCGISEHMVLFTGWVNATTYTVYQETQPCTGSLTLGQDCGTVHGNVSTTDGCFQYFEPIRYNWVAAPPPPAPTTVGMVRTPDGKGYWLVGSDGGVFSFGDAKFYGSLPGLGVKLAAGKEIVGIAATTDGKGYWLAGADGGIFAFGDAGFYNSLPGLHVVPAKPIVGIAATDDNKGYWLAGADGGLFAFGDAGYYGSLPGDKVVPAQPVVGISGTLDSKGYWMVGADGGLYAFGDAGFYNSLPGLHVVPAQPISGMAPSADGKGYWMTGQDGGLFAFGDAGYYGSLPGDHVVPAKPVIGMYASKDGKGYWMVGADGGVFSFGDAKFYGSIPGLKP